MRKRAIALTLLALMATPAAADDTAAMAAVANNFYAVYSALPRTGGIPDATARARYAPLLSPRLNKLIADAAAAEARFNTKNKNSPPLIEGDLFSSLFEGASSVKLIGCSGDSKQGRCNASLSYMDKTQKPVTWTDTLVLINTPSGWKIDDIAYKAGFAFGNTGQLSDTLKMTVGEAP